jgi:hypothetical protein
MLTPNDMSAEQMDAGKGKTSKENEDDPAND